MKSERSLRIQRSRNLHKKESNSPTLASSYSEKRILSKIFKNEPFPRELKRRLMGHMYKFSDFSDEEEETSNVVEEEDEHEVFQKKKKLLPHFKIMSDHGEFASRGKMRSQKKYNHTSPRCKSVQSLKLPQVVEEKKQEDQQRLARNKLSQFMDKNQFNQHNSNRNSETNSLTDKDNMDLNFLPVPEKIIENQAEETKSQKLKNEKSIITSELEKIIVDEVDDRKKKKQQQQQIQSIIEEEKQEDQTDNVKKLRVSLQKLEHQTEYLNKFKEEEFRLSRNNSQTSDRGSDYKQKATAIKHHQQTIRENYQ